MPVRRIPKNYRSVTGLVASDDASHQVTAYESSLERDCIKHLIFNKNVARHEEQPVTISFICAGKQHSYTPDLLITYRNDVAPANTWKPLLAEVKYRSDLLKDWPRLKPKFHMPLCSIGARLKALRPPRRRTLPRVPDRALD